MVSYIIEFPRVFHTVRLACVLFLWIQEVNSVAFRSTSYQGRNHKQACNVYVTEVSGLVDCLRRCDELGYKCLHAASVGNMCYVCIEGNIYKDDSDITFNNTHSQNTQHLLGVSQILFEKTDIVDECLSSPCIRGVCDNRERGYYCECPEGYTGVQCETVLWECADFYKSGQKMSGAYTVYPSDISNVTHKVQVYCDMTTSGGGWTLFQKRYDGSVLFNRTWEEYKNGFGNILEEHWLGNKYISMMTNSNQTKYKLRVDLMSFDGQASYAEYTDFLVATESDKFKLSFGTYSGTAGDGGRGLSYHRNRYFSTRDRDNSCSLKAGHGGFWYGGCHEVNLNGVYRNNPKYEYTGIVWEARSTTQVMQATSMKFRRIIFP